MQNGRKETLITLKLQSVKSKRPTESVGLFFSLIRSLFPRWNFFDKIAYAFELEFKIAETSSWEPLSFLLHRSPLGLFFNPTANITLAQINLIEHFAHDIQELQKINPLISSLDVENLTSFKLLRSLIRQKLKEKDLNQFSFQFKVIACNSQQKIDLYISHLINGDRK